MMSLIEVKCPHCGTQGQILLPPMGAIIIGPCPHCEGMVVVFSGKVLPLEQSIMRDGTMEEKKEHLLETLGAFLHERIDRLLSEQGPGPAEPAPSADTAHAAGADAPAPRRAALPAAEVRPYGKSRAKPISQSEFDTFVRIDLQMIDNPEYFKAVFS